MSFGAGLTIGMALGRNNGNIGDSFENDSNDSFPNRKVTSMEVLGVETKIEEDGSITKKCKTKICYNDGTYKIE